MDGDKEVIFECWVHKYQGDGRGTFRFSSSWKKRYSIILRHGNQAQILYYDKKPRSLQDTPIGRIPLDSWFTVHKKAQHRGQSNVCQVTTATASLVTLATEEEKLFHLLTFFLQTQIKLKETFEGESFVVRPDGSDDHMKLGSRGSMCLLHVSKGGVTLALQLSRSVLTQWPLSCIKFYESLDRGQFSLETGKNAPTGAGKFIFNTRLDENNRIYDLLDAYVMELAGLKEIAMSRASAQSVTMESLVDQQFSTLQSIVVPDADSRFISHLKKVSRGIYDQLAEHLGATSHSHLDVSKTEPTDTTPPMMKFGPKRSNSQQGARPKQPRPKDDYPSMSLDRRPKQSTPSKKPDALSTSAPVAKIRSKQSVESSPKKAGGGSLDLQYLDMGSSPKKEDLDRIYINTEEQAKVPNPADAVVYYSNNESGNVSIGATRPASLPDREYLPMSGSETSSIRGNSFLSELDATSPRSSYGNDSFAAGSPQKYAPAPMVNHSSPKKNREGAPTVHKQRLSTFYEDMGGTDEFKSQAIENLYQTRNPMTLNRQLSHSLDDMTLMNEYSQMSGDGVPPTYNWQKPLQNPDQLYSYAAPSNIQGASNIRRMKTTADKRRTLYAMPHAPTMRKSMSMSHLLGAEGSLGPNVYERPPMELPDENNASAVNPAFVPHNNNHLSFESEKKANRPTNFDFSKMKSPGKPKSSRKSYESQKSTEHPMTPASADIYTHVGNSKFWSTSLDPTPSPNALVTPTSMKGIVVTDQTRVFSRKMSPEKQRSSATSQHQEQQQHQQQPLHLHPSDLDTVDHADIENALLRRSDLSSSSMRGRRLPSLPPGAKLPVDGIHVKGTLC